VTISLEQLAAERGAKPRDCRTCAQFAPQGDDLAYGWCFAHRQFVKLYHPAEFWSQCQFKALARERVELPNDSRSGTD
jgi:hypothetical protein